MHMPARRPAVTAAATACLLLPLGAVAVTTGSAAAAPAATPARDAAALARAVTLDGTLRHMRALQQIADVNGADRAAGTPGYSASAGYVAGQLTAAGYEVTYDPFDFAYFAEDAPAVLQRTAPTAKTYPATEVLTLTYSGSGDVTAPVQAVDLTLPPGAAGSSTSGCETADFATFTRGRIALLQRGTCTFEAKAANAQAAGAVGVIIFNEGQEGRQEPLAGTLSRAFTIPVVGTSFATGQELAAAGTTVRLAIDTTNETRSTYNVLAETKGGRADNVVVVGAHLDSVEEGPGINDNGSGSAVQLEVALQQAKRADPVNRVRFAWWGAEELGLLGSEHYVTTRTATQLGDIALNLNFDMLASPNFARFVYDGDDSDVVGAPAGPAGSAAVEQTILDFFRLRGLPTEGTDFDGRSDYGPFIAAGIPAGGIFSGAEGIKTAEQAAKWGGTAGVAFDPCYHLACDTSRNLSRTALDQNADAVASVVARFAASTEAVNGRTDRAPGKAAAKKLRQFSNTDVR